MVKHSFFWKFSRDGKFSTTYAAFILDVPDFNINPENTRLLWKTSFGGICKVLLLLQDIEIVNEKNNEKRAGLKKPEYIKAVNACGFFPPNEFPEKRKDIVSGKAVMGRHNGSPLDWGYFEDDDDSDIIVDVSKFQPSLNISGANGFHASSGSRDLLSCYRIHPKFSPEYSYWDLMPLHAHMALLYSVILHNKPSEAIRFVENELGWQRI